MSIRNIRSVLIGTALTLPLGNMAYGQSLVDINEQELSGKSEECQTLAQTYRGTDDPKVVPEDEVVTAINEDNAEQCSTLEQQVMTSSGQGDSATEEETVSEEVNLSEDATIEGQAEVTVPDPNVDVQVPAPNVTVTEQQPQVTVTEQPVDIQLSQKQPTVSVEIPDIIVRVQIPSPDVYILRSDPQVEVSSGDPDVQVEQGEPTVNVTQADPELDVNLGVDTEEGTAESEQANAQTGESSGEEVQSASGDTEVASSEPQVEIVDAEGEPQVNIESGDPQVSYESAEPQVSVMMAEQPTIEIEQTGEPNVTFETQEEREQRLAQQDSEQQSAQTEQPVSEQPQNSDEPAASTEEQQLAADATSEPQPDEAQAGTMMTVSDLLGMNVVTADGEGLGNPDAVVEINGVPNLVLSSGGFLGIGGKQVPVRLSRVSLQGEDLVVDAMTEDEIEAASNFEYDSNLEMPDDEQVELGGS